MLEMAYDPQGSHTPTSSLSSEEKKPAKDEAESAEVLHKQFNKIHKLEKDVLYWQDKVSPLSTIV